jgi:predicted hydrocarbon binding protein
MGERKVRGSVINGYMKYVVRTWGKAGLDECLASAKLSDIPIKDGVLYPYVMEQGVITWISGKHGMDHVRKAGNFTVKNLGMLSYLVRFASIETMLEKSVNSYYEAYAFGHVEMHIEGKKGVAKMRDVSDIPENCQGWLGAFEGLLELKHAKKGRVIKTKCQLKGDTQCEYEITWE